MYNLIQQAWELQSLDRMFAKPMILERKLLQIREPKFKKEKEYNAVEIIRLLYNPKVFYAV